MYYGYIGYSRSTEKVYVITRGHNTPEAAEAERILDGSPGDCYACDVCVNGDISPLASPCMLNKRGPDLLKSFP